MQLFFTIAFCCTSLFISAQSIGIGTTTPAPSALLHINSTTKSLLTPRLTTAQRTAIAGAANGLLVYDTNTNSFWYYNSSVWTQIGNSSWTVNNNNISNANAGNIGIGTDLPLYKLDVNGKGAFNGTPVNYGFNGQQYLYSGGALKLTNAVSGTRSNNIIIDGNQVQSYYTDAGLMDEFSNPLLLNALGGNVAIGTTSPLPNSKFTLQTDADYATAITIRNPSGSASFETFIGGPVNGNTISMGTQGAMPIAFYTNGVDRMFIHDNGNVGIGVARPAVPNSTLEVNGSFTLPIRTINGTGGSTGIINANLTDKDYTLVIDCSNGHSGTVYVYLPEASARKGRIYHITTIALPWSLSGNSRILVLYNNSPITELFAYQSLAANTIDESERKSCTLQSNGSKWLMIDSDYFRYSDTR
jgi:hypothetical protein